MSDLGIDDNQASRWQLEAKVSEEMFEKWLGEMLVGMKKLGEISEGQPRTVGIPRQYLSDLDISRDLSSRAQRIASVPEDKFEAVIGQLKQDEQQITRMARIDLQWGATLLTQVGLKFTI